MALPHHDPAMSGNVTSEAPWSRLSDRVLALGLIAAGLMLAAATSIGIEVMVERQARAEAERRAGEAVTLLTAQIPEIENLLAHDPAVAIDRTRLERVERLAGVARLRLFDETGQLVLGPAGPGGKADVNSRARRQIDRGQASRPVVGDRRTGDAGVEGDVSVPIRIGQRTGLLSVHVDRAESRALFRKVVPKTMQASVAILALAFLLLGAALLCQRRGSGWDRAAKESRKAATAARDEAERLATTDLLTGLLNRRTLAKAYEARRGMLSERDLVLTLLLLDLDHFKSVNDSDGHDAGDAVLVRLGQILRETIRNDDVAGRLGGDEFLLILTSPRYEQHGTTVAENLLEYLRSDPEFSPLTVPVSASIGLTRVWKAETTLAEALKQADLALARAKRDGRNRRVDYEPAMGESHARRKRMLREITVALKSDDILPAYQPAVAIPDGAIVAVEALARWREADGARLEAARFPAAFEDARLGTMISQRILDRAIADGGRLRRAGCAFGRIAVNVSEAQVADPGFAERLLDRLLIDGLSPRELTLELTDNTLRSHREAAIVQTLEELSHAGVKIALDDFGAGFATLTHLLRFPIDQIKLDRSIVRDVVAEPAARTVIAAVIGMAHDLGMKVVAEGVETARIGEALHEMGCDHGQGFFYARPVPIDRLESLLTRGRAA